MIQSEDHVLEKKFTFSKKISLMDQYNFYEYIAVMLDSGVGVTKSLDSVTTKITNPYFNLKIKELITYISSGDSFSKAMKKIPQVFGPREISIIESGEIIGKLGKSLLRVSDDLKKTYELQNKIKGALTYPMIIFLFLLVAIVVVLVYVIPTIKPLFVTAEIELPLATQALIATSDFIRNNFFLLILFFASAFVFFIGYKNTKTGREAIDAFLLSLPLVGKVYKNYLLSHIASTLGALIGSGVGIVKTLNLVGKASNNAVYESIFEGLVVQVSNGNKIVESMQKLDEDHEYFPADFIQMLSVGEQTAKLESISQKIYAQYTREVEYSLARLTKWIEPMAILIAGIFVVWFAMAIFGAIMKVTTSIA